MSNEKRMLFVDSGWRHSEIGMARDIQEELKNATVTAFQNNADFNVGYDLVIVDPRCSQAWSMTPDQMVALMVQNNPDTPIIIYSENRLEEFNLKANTFEYVAKKHHGRTSTIEELTPVLQKYGCKLA